MSEIRKQLLTVPIGSVKPYENNPRKNDEAVGYVKESIKQTGYNNPIIVDEDMVVLAGHTRLKSLKALGSDNIEVLQVNGLTDEQKRKFRLLDNKTSEYGLWDYYMLAGEIEGLEWGDLKIDWGIEYEKYSPDDESQAETKEDSKQEYECPKCGYIFRA